jgi:NADH:ubiquinone oxidoreductase subunit 6 (subunit J)
MNGVHTFFYLFIATAAVSGFSILLVKNVLHAVLLLLVCLLSLAGLYVLLSAEFLAVVQILMYAGGVVVLIIFGIMLSSRISNKPLEATSQNTLPGYLTGISFLILLILCFREVSVINTVSGTSIQTIGIALMTDYAAPFELAGILLLVTLLGAAVTAGIMEKKS